MSANGEPLGASAGAAFTDRSRRLAALGVLEVLVGAGAALLALLIPVLAIVARRLPALDLARLPPRLAAAEALNDILIAALFVACGIGSMRARRWVRPVMLIVGWTWLACGVLATGVLLFVLPDLVSSLFTEGELPPAARIAAVAMTLGMAGLLGVLLPAIVCWGYHGRDVGLTCEARNPAPAWTDRCPAPVLAWSAGLAGGAVFCGPLALIAALPCFGTMLTGMPAALLTLAGGAAAGYLAWACYRLRMDGFWGSLALLALAQASVLVTLRRLDLLEIYRALGTPEEQLALLQPFASAAGTMAGAWSLLLTLACAGYLVFIRGHFAARAPTRTGPPTR